MRATQPASSITTESVLRLRPLASASRHVIVQEVGVSYVTPYMGVIPKPCQAGLADNPTGPGL